MRGLGIPWDAETPTPYNVVYLIKSHRFAAGLMGDRNLNVCIFNSTTSNDRRQI